MIKTAICSYGYSTKVFHIPFIEALQEYQLKAFVERNKQESKEKFPEAKIYRSCEDLFSDSDIDLIIVNTPNPTHYEYAYKALAAGKHVVIDKPFASNTSEAISLIQLAEEKGKILSAFHNRRWEGELLAVKEIVEKGLLGKLYDVSFKFERFRFGLNPKAHKEEDRKGNGIVYELGTHLIDQAIFIFGKPNEIYAEIEIQRKDSKVDDYCNLSLYYEDGLIVRLKSSLLVVEQGPAYVLNGTLGSFRKYRSNIQEIQLAQGIPINSLKFAKEEEESSGLLSLMDTEKGVTKWKYASPQSSYLGFYQQLSDAIIHKKEPPVSPNDALLGLQIIEAAYKSNSLKKRIPL